MAKRIYNNKNGNMEVKDFVRLIHTGEIDKFLRGFNTIENPCPPYSLIDDSINCFYCVDCFRHTMSQVKECKDHYKVGKIKLMISDLDKGE